MQKLEHLYKISPSGKFRYSGWDHKTKFFTITALSKDGAEYIGKLDCGTPAKFLKKSDFWESYNEGDEYCAKAV
jgi:hypothetical protein